MYIKWNVDFMSRTFILINDPDHGRLSRLKKVFTQLNRWDIKVTTAVFCTLEELDESPVEIFPGILQKPYRSNCLSRHCYRGETGALDEPAYRDFMLEQRDNGHEIAYHGYSQISNTRDKFEKGLEMYKDIFGEYPFTYIEHGGIPIHHPPDGCKKERLDWLGSTPENEHYIKDIIKDKISCVWAYFALLDGPEGWRGSAANLTPKMDADLFCKEDDILLFRRWRSHYLNKLQSQFSSVEETTFIGYTHFGYDHYGQQGYAIDDWRTQESCDLACRLLRDIIDMGNMRNKTLRQHVIDNNLL